MARHPAVAFRPAGRSPASGFTLVEILVVLSILAVLIAMVAAGIPRAMRMRQVLRGQTIGNALFAGLEGLEKDEDYGKYPPSRPRDLRIGKVFVGKELGHPNDTNCGAEVLHFLFNNPLLPKAPQITTDETLIGNTDEDNFRNARGNAPDTGAREFLDPWGQPWVYFNAADYKDFKGLGEIRSEDGRTIAVRPKKLSAKAGGGFLGPNSFQLFSVGPDGLQDDEDAAEEDSGKVADDIVMCGR